MAVYKSVPEEPEDALEDIYNTEHLYNEDDPWPEVSELTDEDFLDY